MNDGPENVIWITINGKLCKFHKEKPGVISEDEIWVCFGNSRMWTAPTLLECIGYAVLEWNDDRHLVG